MPKQRTTAFFEAPHSDGKLMIRDYLFYAVDCSIMRVNRFVDYLIRDVLKKNNIDRSIDIRERLE